MDKQIEDQVQPLYLNGGWAAGAGTRDVINPASGAPFARVATADRRIVRKALEDAKAAWRGWRTRTGKQRGVYLRRMAESLERRGAEIARTITLENGKPLAQSQAEVAMSVDHLQWFAEEGRRAYGRVVPHQADGKRHLVLKQSVGVVGAIAPWNFPLMLAVRKASPAWAAGCPVVLKPASATPLSAVHLAQAAEEAELPPGVFQFVVGDAREIAAEMFECDACRKITFTGSTQVGRELLRQAAPSIQKLSLELGGHAPVLVFEDADLEVAVEGALITKIRNTGQSCIASNRIYVQEAVYDRFLERFLDRVGSLKIGDGLEEGVDIGPLIDETTLDGALAHVEDAKQRGATVRCGGRRWAGGAGFFLEPTVLTDVPDNAKCMREESFSPLAPVVTFRTEDEAVDKANDTQYGLAAYLFTQDISRAWRVAEQLEAGTVGVNDAVPTTSQCPFGGMKQSGVGRELGSEGLDAFLETKHVCFGNLESRGQ